MAEIKNYSNMQTARNANKALFDNIASLPADIELYDLQLASYTSLCAGCTSPDAVNYDPFAEVDDNTCL